MRRDSWGIILLFALALIFPVTSRLPWELLERFYLKYFIAVFLPFLGLWILGTWLTVRGHMFLLPRRLVWVLGGVTMAAFLLPDPVNASWPLATRLLVSIVVWGSLFSIGVSWALRLQK